MNSCAFFSRKKDQEIEKLKHNFCENFLIFTTCSIIRSKTPKILINISFELARSKIRNRKFVKKIQQFSYVTNKIKAVKNGREIVEKFYLIFYNFM